MGRRTSNDASSTMRASERELPAACSKRTRRKIFSMSIMASSTTAPIAMTKPAKTMVFIDTPVAAITQPAVSRDRGMAAVAINAARHSYKNRIITKITNTHPSSSALDRLSMESSIKVAGRNICVSSSTPGKPGFISSSAASTPSVTAKVLPHGNFSTININPGPSLITASPMGAWGPKTISATSPNKMGWPLFMVIGTCARVSGV